MPRLGTAALPALQAQGSEPLLEWALLDIDNEDHIPWTSRNQADLALDEAIESLPPRLYEAAGGYTTRAGFRLLWRLDPAVPVSLANSLLLQLGGVVASSTGVTIDPISYEWTRQFRVPGALRAGVQLQPALNAQPILDGKALDYRALGFALSEDVASSYDMGDIPEEPDEVSALAWARVNAPGWCINGEPLPPEDGHTYPALRRILAQLAATGDIVDPHALYGMVYRSVGATPNRTLADAWKLASWVAAKQESAIAQRDVEESARPQETQAPSPEEWLKALDRLYRPSQVDRRLLERLAAGARPSRNKADAATSLIRAAQLLAPVLNNIKEVYRFIMPSARESKRLTQDQVWQLCQQAVHQHRQRLQTLLETRAFVDQHPLLVSVARRLYLLNTRTDPYSYSEVCRDDFIAGMFKQLTAPRLPAGLDVDLNQPLKQAFEAYGVMASGMVYVSGQEGAQLEHSGTNLLLRVGVHGQRPCKAKYHGDVHEWLTALGGEDLLDWMAAVPYTTRPVAMLYLHGPKDIGKSLLIQGAASLWSDRAADYNRIANSSFNEDLLTCPVVAADEGLAVGKWDRYRVSQDFRNLVANKVHTVAAKNKTETTLRSSPRVMLCANEADALPIEQSLDQEGLDAIVQRILYVRADASAAAVIKKHGGRDGVAHWVTPGKAGAIAEHILWLASTRTLDHIGRFLVAGKLTDWHRKFSNNQGRKPDVVEILYDILSEFRNDPTVKVWCIDDPRVVWVQLESYRKAMRGHDIRISWKAARVELLKLAVDKGRPRLGNVQVRAIAVPWSAFVDTDIAAIEDLKNLVTVERT